jgi:transposase
MIFMQDGAPAHAAASTRADLEARGIPLIVHPPFSPDLNPIEMAWNWMKDYIQEKFPEKMSYDRLRAAVLEAWEAIPEDFLRDHVYSMPERCEAVITADGKHTKF